MINETFSGVAIRSVATAVPPNRYEQEAITAALREWWEQKYRGSQKWKIVFEQVNRSLRIGGRNLALPPDQYVRILESFAIANAEWLRIAPELAGEAISLALTRAEVEPQDIGHFILVTGTGVATPSIDARIINRLHLNCTAKRTPVFGLGCAGGVAGVSRAADYLRAFPDEIALVASVELCSLTLQGDDLSIANMIASSLFGDGAAAVVIGGKSCDTMPRVVATRSLFFPDTEALMGWEVVPSGFKIVMSRAIPGFIRERIRMPVDELAASQGLSRRSIKHWIVHTGGNRVLEAVGDALALDQNALERSWRMLEANGNLSSASVLFVLDDLIASGEAEPGDYGMMIAVGPGFAAELALLEW